MDKTINWLIEKIICRLKCILSCFCPQNELLHQNIYIRLKHYLVVLCCLTVWCHTTHSCQPTIISLITFFFKVSDMIYCQPVWSSFLFYHCCVKSNKALTTVIFRGREERQKEGWETANRKSTDNSRWFSEAVTVNLFTHRVESAAHLTTQ